MSTFASDRDKRNSPILALSATGSVETQLRASRLTRSWPTGFKIVDSGMF